MYVESLWRRRKEPLGPRCFTWNEKHFINHWSNKETNRLYQETALGADPNATGFVRISGLREKFKAKDLVRSLEYNRITGPHSFIQANELFQYLVLAIFQILAEIHVVLIILSKCSLNAVYLEALTWEFVLAVGHLFRSQCLFISCCYYCIFTLFSYKFIICLLIDLIYAYTCN